MGRKDQSGGPVGFLSSAPVEAGRHGVNSERARILRCRTVATGRFGHRHHVRDLPAFGGGGEDESLLPDDATPNPSEMLLAALSSCLSISIQANAIAQGIPLRRVVIEASGELADAAAFRSPASGVGFGSIHLSVRLDADQSKDALKMLVERAILWSAVSNTLHNPVHLDVDVDVLP